MADPLLAAVGWPVPAPLDAAVCADEVSAGRPTPLMVLRAMELTGVHDRSRVPVVADIVLDIRAGRPVAAGLVVGVLSGAQAEAELTTAGPTHVLPGVADIPDVLGIPARTG